MTAPVKPSARPACSILQTRRTGGPQGRLKPGAMRAEGGRENVACTAKSGNKRQLLPLIRAGARRTSVRAHAVRPARPPTLRLSPTDFPQSYRPSALKACLTAAWSGGILEAKSPDAPSEYAATLKVSTWTQTRVATDRAVRAQRTGGERRGFRACNTCASARIPRARTAARMESDEHRDGHANRSPFGAWQSPRCQLPLSPPTRQTSCISTAAREDGLDRPCAGVTRRRRHRARGSLAWSSEHLLRATATKLDRNSRYFLAGSTLYRVRAVARGQRVQGGEWQAWWMQQTSAPPSRPVPCHVVCMQTH